MGKSALFLVLIALSSCASAFYFPNGAPHRPSRQASKFGLKQLDLPTAVPNNQSDSEILSLDGQDQHPEPEPRDDEDQKPDPKSYPEGIKLIPRRKEPIANRQVQSCGQNYAFSQPGQSVVIQSPNYDREYPNNVRSSTCFTSPDGTTMSVSCDDFNVENERSCSYDYLGLGLSGSPSSVQKYCGRGTLRSPQSSGNSLAVVFVSDSSNPGASSRQPYRFRCSVTVSSDGGQPTTTSAPPPDSGTPGNCTCGKRNDGSRIVGGQNTRPGSIPWRCYMKTKRYSFFCGCSIISNNWIVTAAHCTEAVMPLQNGDVLSVVLGDYDRSTSTDIASQEVTISTVRDHPNYNSDTMDNDISLLKMSRSITFSNSISPICLPFQYANDEFSGENVLASGWGTTSQGGQVSNTLKEVNIPVLTTNQCERYYRGQITQNMICTYEPGKDTCQGDSGGSIDLLRNNLYYHIGVVSWGIGCARENNPGVYTKVTKYLNWIESTAGERFCRT